MTEEEKELRRKWRIDAGLTNEQIAELDNEEEISCRPDDDPEKREFFLRKQ